MNENMKFCKHCGESIPEDAIICIKCGRQVEELKGSKDQSVIINNNVNSSSSSSSTATATATASAINGGFQRGGRGPYNKWVSLLLCIFTICGHKFYEGKILMGIVYLCTGGLFMFGWIFDIVAILSKPSSYYL